MRSRSALLTLLDVPRTVGRNRYSRSSRLYVLEQDETLPHQQNRPASFDTAPYVSRAQAGQTPRSDCARRARFLRPWQREASTPDDAPRRQRSRPAQNRRHVSNVTSLHALLLLPKSGDARAGQALPLPYTAPLGDCRMVGATTCSIHLHSTVCPELCPTHHPLDGTSTPNSHDTSGSFRLYQKNMARRGSRR